MPTNQLNVVVQNYSATSTAFTYLLLLLLLLLLFETASRWSEIPTFLCHCTSTAVLMNDNNSVIFNRTPSTLCSVVADILAYHYYLSCIPIVKWIFLSLFISLRNILNSHVHHMIMRFPNSVLSISNWLID